MSIADWLKPLLRSWDGFQLARAIVAFRLTQLRVLRTRCKLDDSEVNHVQNLDWGYDRDYMSRQLGLT